MGGSARWKTGGMGFRGPYVGRAEPGLGFLRQVCQKISSGVTIDPEYKLHQVNLSEGRSQHPGELRPETETSAGCLWGSSCVEAAGKCSHSTPSTGLSSRYNGKTYQCLRLERWSLGLPLQEKRDGYDLPSRHAPGAVLWPSSARVRSSAVTVILREEANVKENSLIF